MSAIRSILAASIVGGLLLSSLSAWGAETAAANTDVVLDEFLATAGKNKEFTPEQLQSASEAVATLRADPDGRAIAITEALRELYPEYKAALTALGEEDFGAAVPALSKLHRGGDPYLAADAGYFLARACMLDERFEDALPLLADLTGKWSDKTLRGGEALFLQGVAHIQLLQHKEAMDSLAHFLARHPEAPERMRVGAMRQLEQLKAFQAGTLTDVQLRMDYSRRRLALEDTGKDTRGQQDKIIEVLAKLIKEAEERECNCKGGGKGSGQGQKQGQGGEGDSQASGQGQGQEGTAGGGSKGTDDDSVKRLHRGGPQSPWSQLRDKQRDPVFNAIKDRFPGRYQQLIEQYYKSFQDESGS